MTTATHTARMPSITTNAPAARGTRIASSLSTNGSSA